MTRRGSWFRSPRLRRKQLSTLSGERSPAGDFRLRCRRLLLERLEDRSLMAVVSYWSANSTAVDSVGVNNGTLISGATYAVGQVGQAFSFDGVNDRVQVADSASLKLTESMTIEGWVKADSLPVQQGEILFRGDDRGGLDPYSLSVQANGSLRFEVSSLSAAMSVSTSMPVGQLVYVVGTLDDATGAMRLYLNGVLMSQTVTSVRPFAELDPASNPGIGIGNHGGYPTTPHNFPFHGLIDELKLYDTSLTSEEVLANFNAGKGSLQPTISIGDVVVAEGDPAIQYLGNLVSQSQGGLDDPYALEYGPDGSLYVSSRGASTILRYNGTTGAPLPAVGKPGAEFVSPGAGGLSMPREITFGPDGNLYVVSELTGAILRYDADTGEPLSTFVPEGTGGLAAPRGLLFHGGYLYVTSVGSTTTGPGTDSILRFDASTGAPAGLSAIPGNAVFIPSGTGGMDNPSQIVFQDGDFYVSSTSPSTSNSVLRFGTDGTPKGTFVSAGFSGLSGPVDLVFHDGYLYVTSWANNKILRYDGVSGAFVNEVVSANGLMKPFGLVFEPSGDFLVASADSDEIRRYGISGDAVITVSLSAPFPTSVSVSYTTADGSAIAGGDYTAATGSITFEPGEFNKTIRVPVFDDAVAEGSETFFVNLSTPVGGTIEDGQGICTILDEPPIPPLPPTKFYVVNDGSPDRTYEYGANGAASENYAIVSGNSAPRGAASTTIGDKVWVVDVNKNVYVYSPSGALLGSWAATGLTQPEGIATDGENIWIVDAGADKVFRYLNAGSRLSGSQAPVSDPKKSFKLNSGNKDAKDIVAVVNSGGTFLYVVNGTSTTDKVFRYKIDGTDAGNWTISTPGATTPTGITLDPSNSSQNIWIVDSGTDRVYQYDTATTRTSGSQAASTSFALAAGNTNPQGIADPPVGGAPASEPAAPAPAMAVVVATSAARRTPQLSYDTQDQTELYLPMAAIDTSRLLPDSRWFKTAASAAVIDAPTASTHDEALGSIADELEGLIPTRKFKR